MKSGRSSWIQGSHTAYSGILLVRGAGTYIDEPTGRSWDLKPGDFFHRIPGRAHTQTVGTDGKWVEAFVAFGRPLFDALVAMGCLRPTRPVLRPGLSLELVLRFEGILAELKSAPDEELPCVLARILELLAHRELSVSRR